MSGFSAEWLSLREPVDQRSRDRSLARQLADHVAGESKTVIVDLGCGKGSNLRALAPLLGPDQSWTLVDNDLGLLVAAKQALVGWADQARDAGDEVVLRKAEKTIRVSFRAADLARGIDGVIPDSATVVTASAFFDLASYGFIVDLARDVARHRAAFYTVLTYNGVQRWTPEHPSDRDMAAAFHEHQMTDKGLGLAVGPQAPRHLAAAFGACGYRVIEADTPWQIGSEDARLLERLETGFYDAVLETGLVNPKLARAWRAVERTGAEVGHTDTLALPAD